MSFDISIIENLIKNRRSVRPPLFNNDIVLKEEVVRCLEMANWAPTHGNTEPWRFKVFGPKSTSRFAKEHIEFLLKHKPDLPQVKKDKMLMVGERSSYVIAIICQMGLSDKIPEIEEIEAVSCAVQNLHLMAHAQGLAGFWSTGGATHIDAPQDWLGLKPDQKLMGFFYLGKTDKEFIDFKKGKVEDKIEWIDE